MKIQPHLMEDIKAFHEKFKLPPAPEPSFLAPELLDFRTRFLQEELDEFITAHRNGNLADCLDSLVDLVYVALGTAYHMNLPFDKAWAAVHTANMAKVRAERPSDSKRKSSFDVIKPPGWTPPDIEAVIEEYQLELAL